MQKEASQNGVISSKQQSKAMHLANTIKWQKAINNLFSYTLFSIYYHILKSSSFWNKFKVHNTVVFGLVR